MYSYPELEYQDYSMDDHDVQKPVLAHLRRIEASEPLPLFLGVEVSLKLGKRFSLIKACPGMARMLPFGEKDIE